MRHIIAQTYRSLTLDLIREIRKHCQEMEIDFQWNKGNNELAFPNGSIIYAFSAESPDAILGLTEISLLAIDEVVSCTEEIYNNQVTVCMAPSILLRSVLSARLIHWEEYLTGSLLYKRYPKKVIVR